MFIISQSFFILYKRYFACDSKTWCGQFFVSEISVRRYRKTLYVRLQLSNGEFSKSGTAIVHSFVHTSYVSVRKSKHCYKQKYEHSKAWVCVIWSIYLRARTTYLLLGTDGPFTRGIKQCTNAMFGHRKCLKLFGKSDRPLSCPLDAWPTVENVATRIFY